MSTPSGTSTTTTVTDPSPAPEAGCRIAFVTSSDVSNVAASESIRRPLPLGGRGPGEKGTAPGPPPSLAGDRPRAEERGPGPGLQGGGRPQDGATLQGGVHLRMPPDVAHSELSVPCPTARKLT